MDDTLSLIIFSGTDDKLTAAAVLAAGAAAMDRKVNVLLQYWGLDAFRVDRIQEPVLTGHRFVRTEEPDAAAMVAEGLAVGAYSLQATVVLLVPHREAAAEIPRTVGSLEPHEDGALLRIGGSDLRWLATYLAALPFGFRVLDPPELRDELRALGRRLVAEYPYQVKFVVDSLEDCREVEAYLAGFPQIDRRRAMLMPQGTDPAALARQAEWLEPYCRRHDLHFCPRRQIEWYGFVRGT